MQTSQDQAENATAGKPLVGKLPQWVGITLVLALTFLVYAPTLRYGFVHDDRGQIVDNPAVRTWRAVPGYFTAHAWATVFPNEWINYYRPIFLLWLRMNHAVFGYHAWGWHLTTVLTHVISTLLLYLLVLRLRLSRTVALVAALIFGLHPAHIEAVDWVSAVTEPLAAVFLLGALLAYLKSRRTEDRHSARWKLGSVGLFALAILEKETSLVLPGILVGYEWIYRRDDTSPLRPEILWAWCRETLRRVWPYFVLVAGYVVVRIHALKGFAHVVTQVSPVQMALTWPSLIGFWLWHLLWPTRLSTYYNFPPVDWPNWGNFALPLLFDIVVAVALYVGARRSRPASFFALWLVAPLIPLLNLRVFLANDFVHDRYLYLPSLGFAALVAMLLEKWCSGPARWWRKPASVWAAVLSLIAVMSYGTLTEGFYSRNNRVFYAYNLTKAPHTPSAESNYASLLAEGGEYPAAVAAFLDVVKYNPAYWPAIYNLAVTYYKMGNLVDAEKYLLDAIRIGPKNPGGYFYLGLTRFKAGHPTEAIAALRQAIALDPHASGYHFALGVMLKSQGDSSGALQEYRQEITHSDDPAMAAQAKALADELSSQPSPKP